MGMRERVQALGGEFRAEVAAGRGPQGDRRHPGAEIDCREPMAGRRRGCKVARKMTQTPIRVMLVGRPRGRAHGLSACCSKGAADIKVVGEAESGEEAVRSFAEVKPDVVVMDISMPGIGGLEAIGRILAREPQARILVLSAHEDAMHARRVLKAGRRRLSHQAQRGRGADPGDPPGCTRARPISSRPSRSSSRCSN